MKDVKILSAHEVIEKGIEFDGDVVCFSGMYGQHVYNRPMELGGEPVTGLVYEKYKNGCLAYYCYYENGISNGEYVEFYESGKIKKFREMLKGTIHGECMEWYVDGSVKSKEYFKYGISVYMEEWDESGDLFNKRTEPLESHKALLKKYESMYSSGQDNKDGTKRDV